MLHNETEVFNKFFIYNKIELKADISLMPVYYIEYNLLLSCSKAGCPMIRRSREIKRITFGK